jgi:hypothetical protein
MIVVDDPNILQDAFIKLLESIKNITLQEVQNIGENASRLNGDEFETLVYNNSLKASQHSQFEGHVIQTGPHAFPDIIARKYFGIEVKMTTGNKWVSTGNSILESTRIDEVEKIFMFFGKFGGDMDIKYRSYQECLYDIGVTHSPRYKIDMDLPDGKSIFDKMGIPYSILRKEKDSIGKIKDYYRKQLKDGEELWWIDTQSEQQAVSPIIKPFRMLTRADQDKFFIESMILFPEIFGKNGTKYERPAAYLITKYNSVSSSLRDIFTAGGQASILVNNKTYTVPKLFAHLKEYATQIEEIITQMPGEELKYYWRFNEVSKPYVEQWKQLLDYYSRQQLDNVSASDIYKCGLK